MGPTAKSGRRVFSVKPEERFQFGKFQYVSVIATDNMRDDLVKPNDRPIALGSTTKGELIIEVITTI
jgi:hypothetical protein